MSDIQVVFSPRTPENKARLVMEALKTRISKYTELRGASTNYYFTTSRTNMDIVVLVNASDDTLQKLKKDLQEWRNKHFSKRMTLEVKRP